MRGKFGTIAEVNMMQGTLRRALLVIGLLVICGPSAAADERQNIGAAKQAFKAGQEFMKMERYADAVVEFRKAYSITQDGLVMGQVALAYEKGGDYEAALGSIRKYREALPASDRASVDPLIAKYEKLIKEGKSKPLVLPGDKVQPVIGAVGATTAGDDGATPPPPAEEKESKGRLWTWVAAGTAAALGISALVVGLSAQSKYDELNDRCGSDAAGVCAQSDVDSVNTRAIVTDVLWTTALAAGITAVVLFFVEGSGSGEKSSSSDIDDQIEEEEEEEDELVQDIRLAPLAGAGTVGLGALLRF